MNIIVGEWSYDWRITTVGIQMFGGTMLAVGMTRSVGHPLCYRLDTRNACFSIILKLSLSSLFHLALPVNYHC